jgi:aminoglycoside phosphotransferase family enzyme/predicted kinase
MAEYNTIRGSPKESDMSHQAKGASRPLKEDLLRPGAYASIARSPTVQCIETHISWVFVLAEDVFKVKKPVRLGFLDFSTMRRRRSACEAEVCLNRRLAPDVYVGTVPIVRGDDGRGRVCTAQEWATTTLPAVDWAVHMKRLPDAERADTLLGKGALDREAIDAIAVALAAFHRGCLSTAASARWGAPASIARNLEENFAQTRSRIEQYLSPREAGELRRWQRSFLRGHSSLFSRRVAEGRVRDGHGDLRLEHVYLRGCGVTVLDCIEFNKRFRFADVCADIAFLSMDLAGHGRVDLAERLLAVYARETNDFDLYALVDFYESYRAYVRGKIAAMIADDESVGRAVRQRAREEARRYFLLALSADRRSLLQPAVVAVGGLIASGKSTIAECIGRELSAPVIEADRTRKGMLGIMATTRVEDQAWTGAYDPSFTETVYDEIIRRAGVVLDSGRPVVLDASFRSVSMRNAARDLARRYNVPFRFVECRATADVCRARLALREQHAAVSDGRLAIFEDFCVRFEPVQEIPEAEHTAINTTLPIEENLDALRGVLQGWPRGLVT